MMALELKVPQRPLGQSQNLHILPLVTLSLCLFEIALCDMTGSSSVLFGIEKSKLMEKWSKEGRRGGKESTTGSTVQSSKLAPARRAGIGIRPLSS